MPLTAQAIEKSLGIGVLGLRTYLTDLESSPPTSQSIGIVQTLVDLYNIAPSNLSSTEGLLLERAYFTGAPNVPEPVVSLKGFLEALLAAIIAIFEARGLQNLADALRRAHNLDILIGDILNRINKFNADSIAQQDAVNRFLRIMPGSPGTITGSSAVTADMFSNATTDINYTTIRNHIASNLATVAGSGTITSFLQEMYTRLILDSLENVQDLASNTTNPGVGLINQIQNAIMGQSGASSISTTRAALVAANQTTLVSVWDTLLNVSDTWTNNSNTGVLDIIANTSNSNLWSASLVNGTQAAGNLDLSTCLSSGVLNQLKLTIANLTSYASHVGALLTTISNGNPRGYDPSTSYSSYATTIGNDFTTISNAGNIFVAASGTSTFGSASSKTVDVWYAGDNLNKNTYYYNSTDGLFYQSLVDIQVVPSIANVSSWISNHSYPSGSIVEDTDNFYYMATSAISSASHPSADTTHWKLVSVSEAYVSSNTYALGNFVTDGGYLYQAISSNIPNASSPSLVPTSWVQINKNNPGFYSLDSSFAFQKGLLAQSVIQGCNKINACNPNYYGVWSNATNYSPGQYVRDNAGNFYYNTLAVSHASLGNSPTSFGQGTVLTISGASSNPWIVKPGQTAYLSAYNSSLGATYTSGNVVLDGSGNFWKRTSTTIPTFNSAATVGSGSYVQYGNAVYVNNGPAIYQPAIPNSSQNFSSYANNVFNYGGTLYVGLTSATYVANSGLSTFFTNTSNFAVADGSQSFSLSAGQVFSYGGNNYIANSNCSYTAGSGLATFLSTYFSLYNAPITPFFNLVTAPPSTYWTGGTANDWLNANSTILESYSGEISDFFTYDAARTTQYQRYVSNLTTLATAYQTLLNSNPTKLDQISVQISTAFSQLNGVIDSTNSNLTLLTNSFVNASTDAQLALAIHGFIEQGLKVFAPIILTNPSDSVTIQTSSSTTLSSSVVTLLNSWKGALYTSSPTQVGTNANLMATVLDSILALINNSTYHISTNSTKTTALTNAINAFENAVTQIYTDVNSTLSDLATAIGTITGTNISYAGCFQHAALNSLDTLRDEFAAFIAPTTYSSATSYQQYYVVNDGTNHYYQAVCNNHGQALSDTTYWLPIDLNVYVTEQFDNLNTAAINFNGSLAYRLNSSGTQIHDVMTAQNGLDLQTAVLGVFNDESSSGLSSSTPFGLRPNTCLYQSYVENHTYNEGDILQKDDGSYYLWHNGAISSTTCNPPSPINLYYEYVLHQLALYPASSYWQGIQNQVLAGTGNPPIGPSGSPGLLANLKTSYQSMSSQITVPNETQNSVCSTNSNNLNRLDPSAMSANMTHFNTIRTNMISIMDEINLALTHQIYVTSYAQDTSKPTTTTADNSNTNPVDRWHSSLVVPSNEMTTMSPINSESRTVTSDPGGINYGETTFQFDISTISDFNNAKAGAGTFSYYQPIAAAAMTIFQQLAGFQNFFYTQHKVPTYNDQWVRASLYDFSTWGYIDGRFTDVFYDLYVNLNDVQNHFNHDVGEKTAQTASGTLVETAYFRNLLDSGYNEAKNYFNGLVGSLANWDLNYNLFHEAVATQAQLWMARAYATTTIGEDLLFKAVPCPDISPQERKLLAKVLNLIMSLLVSMLASNAQVRQAVTGLFNGTITLQSISLSITISQQIANNLIQRAVAMTTELLDEDNSSKQNSSDFVASSPMSAQDMYDLATTWQANHQNAQSVRETQAHQQRYSS